MFLMTLPALSSTGQVFRRMSLYQDLPDGFLLTRLGFGVWGEEDHRAEVPFSSHLKGTCCQRDSCSRYLDHLTEVTLVRCSPCGYFSHAHPLQVGGCLHSLRSGREWNYAPAPCGRSVSKFAVVLQGRFISLLFTQSFISV